MFLIMKIVFPFFLIHQNIAQHGNIKLQILRIRKIKNRYNFNRLRSFYIKK